jgi:hypothetical protein
VSNFAHLLTLPPLTGEPIASSKTPLDEFIRRFGCAPSRRGRARAHPRMTVDDHGGPA